MDYLYAIVFFGSFFLSFAATKYVIRKCWQKRKSEWDAGFLVPDFARKNSLVPRLGGLGILAGFAFGVLIPIKIVDPSNHIQLFAVLTTILLVGIMAFFNDLLKMSGLLRTIIPAIASMPLIAISAGVTQMTIPFIGAVDFGVFYSILLVPIGIAACSNLINILAGHNGLEAGTSAVVALSLLTALALRYSVLGIPAAPFIIPVILLVSFLGAVFAFLYFNWYPARVFPGDTGTYVMGAVIACAAITGNIEKVGVIALMPQIIEFFLKARSKFRAENFGKMQGNRMQYSGEIYSLTHIIMKYFRPTERGLTVALILFQAFWGAVAVSSLFW